MRNFNKAFTLSEALIALGIVGVISALTIPALVNSTSRNSVGPALGRAVAAVEAGCAALVQNSDVEDILNKSQCLTNAGDVASNAGAYDDSGTYRFYKMRTTYTVTDNITYTFDVNGAGGRNVAGVDRFQFTLLSNGKLQPTGLGLEDTCPATPANCAARVVADGYRVTYNIN